MRRLFIAAVSAAIVTTTVWSQAKADSLSSFNASIAAAANAGPAYQSIFVKSIPRLVVGAFYSPNNRTSFDSLNNLSAVIQYVTGIRQPVIPQFSFGLRCNANNFLKTCF
jgi:hypothetical protein